MFFPVMIKRLQQYTLFNLPPDGLVKHSTLRFELGIGHFRHTVFNGFRIKSVFLYPAINIWGKAKQFSAFLLEGPNVPLFRIGTLWAVTADKSVHGVVKHVPDDIIDAFGIHDLAALIIDNLALIVHNIVIFNELLTNVVVTRFHLALRRFDCLR